MIPIMYIYYIDRISSAVVILPFLSLIVVNCSNFLLYFFLVPTTNVQDMVRKISIHSTFDEAVTILENVNETNWISKSTNFFFRFIQMISTLNLFIIHLCDIFALPFIYIHYLYFFASHIHSFWNESLLY